LAQPTLKKVQFSVHIIKADSGKTIYQHNAHTPLIPASNMKLIVTATALNKLGTDFQYKTTIGLLADNLVIVAAGDPLLGDPKTDEKYNRTKDWIFNQIISALKRDEITSINNIIIDSSVFDDQRVHPNWPTDQLNKWYASEVAGLNYNDNCIDMTVKNINGSPRIYIEPQTDFIKILNQVKIVQNAKGAVGAYRTAQTNSLVVRGRCAKQQGPFSVAIERPAAFFGFLLAEKLNKAGIKTTGKLFERPVDANFYKIAEFTTSISDCIDRSNKNSLQIATESLFKTIAAQSNPDKKNGSWETGRKVISKYLTSLGIKEKEFYIDDGSGLSRKNKLSAFTLTKVLLSVYESKDWQIYKDSLAVGGVDGTLEKYFKEPKYKAKIFGKTGYIKTVRTFSGLATTQNGDYIFSILTNNNYQGRKILNDIVKAVIDESQNNDPH